MKKIVIAMLLILPLIIVSVVMIATNIIASEVYIAVDRVELRRADNSKLDTAKTIELDLAAGEYALKAVVLPTAAKNKKIFWSVADVTIEGVEVDDPNEYPDTYPTVTADGIDACVIRFFAICTFDIIVTTAEGSKTAMCNFKIKSEKISEIDVNLPEDFSLTTGASVRLLTPYKPAFADLTELTFTSSDPNILFVDGNGIVTAKKAGTANITVTANGQATKTKAFTVKAGVTLFGTEFYTSGSFALSSIEPNGAVFEISGCKIEGGAFSFLTDASSAVIRVGSVDVTIHRCAEIDIVIRNADILSQGIMGGFVYAKGLPIYIEAVYLDALRYDKPEAGYNVNFQNIANIDQKGKLVILDKGNFIVTAEANGVQTQIAFNAVYPVSFIRLRDVNRMDVRGIAGETIYGTKNADGTNFVVELFIQYPENADWADFTAVTDRPDLARVEGHKIVIIGEIKVVTAITITVTAKYPTVESGIRARRTMKFLDGANCYTYAEIKAVADRGERVMVQKTYDSDGNVENIVLSADNGTIELKADYYGNDIIIDGTAVPKNKKPQDDTAMFKIVGDNVKISGAYWRFERHDLINEANGMSGVILRVGEKNQPERFENIVIQYSILENGYFAVELHNSTTKIDGCIIRNTSNFGISLPTNLRDDTKFDRCDYTDLYVNNIVMSNIIAVGIGVSTNAELGKNNPLPKQSNLYCTGFFDCYNWQDVLSGQMLNRELIPDNDKANTALATLIRQQLGSVLAQDTYNSIRYDLNGHSYIHLAVVVSGATFESKAVVTFEDARMHEAPFEKVNALIVGALKLFGMGGYPVQLYTYQIDANITPNDKLEDVMGPELYKKLRGEK